MKINRAILPPGRIGLAVSGGSDSVALAFLLTKGGKKQNAAERFVILHVDHGLRAESKEEYLATIQAYFTITNIYAFAMRAAGGLVTAEALRYAAWGVPAIALGVFLGRRAFRALNADRLRFVVYLFMALSGVVTLVRG